jgi:hypothetical protein
MEVNGSANGRFITHPAASLHLFGKVIGNTAAVDRRVDCMPGNSQDGQCGPCERGWHQYSSHVRARAYS